MRRVGVLLFTVVLFALTAQCGGGGGGVTGTDSPESTFSNGSMTLTTNISSTASAKTVVVSQKDGGIVLTMEITTSGIKVSAPGYSTRSMTFPSPLPQLPTDFVANRMALVAAGGIANGKNAAYRDAPGCDWIELYGKCAIGCCAEHDRCYNKNRCTWVSWLWPQGLSCDACNINVTWCIASDCYLLSAEGTSNNCYDASCDATFDCPPDYDHCKCKTKGEICAGDSPEDIEGWLEGTWQSSSNSSDCMDYRDTFVLKSDGTYSGSDASGGGVERGTYTVAGDHYSASSERFSTPVVGGYTCSGYVVYEGTISPDRKAIFGTRKTVITTPGICGGTTCNWRLARE